MRSDAELIRDARAGEAAFRELYDRYAVRVHRYHVRRTGHEDAALDLTAETFAQAWISRERFRDESGGSAAPWLFAIARHVLLASVRRRRLERGACERLGVLEALDRPPADVEPTEAWLDGLDEALAELPEGQRRAVRLRVIDDLSYEEVAGQLGTSPLGARLRVSRGLNTLRNRMTSPLEETR